MVRWTRRCRPKHPRPPEAAPALGRQGGSAGVVAGAAVRLGIHSRGRRRFLCVSAFLEREQIPASSPSTRINSFRIGASGRRGGGARRDGAELLLENLEVTGLRLVEDKQKKLEVRFVLVNHSPAPLTDIAATVTLRPSTAKPGKDIVGTFAFRLPGLEPYESRDMLAPVEAKMRLYELPDWQFLRADVVLTSPLLRR